MSALPEFDLTWQWCAAPASRSAELDATWAQLRIAVGADPVTLVHEPATGTYREHITVALYPLAEWIAYNWWSLIADARPGTQISQLRGAYRNGVGDQRGSWWVRSRRHTMRAAGDGFRWPDVLFVSEGMLTRVVWMPDSGTDPRQDMRFTGRGNATVPSTALERTLTKFVDAVVARLTEQGVTGTPLADEWGAVRGASNAEAAFCRRAAQLGLDPYRDADVHADDITSARRMLPAHLADDFFNGVGAERVHDQLTWLDKARVIVGTDDDMAVDGVRGDIVQVSALAELREVCADIADRFYNPNNYENPWELGFETAQRVRAHLGVPDTAEFDPGDYLAYHTEAVPYLDRGLVAFGTRSGQQGPSLVSTRVFTSRPRRFLLARALWHVLCDRNETFLIVASHTHRQHIARGFALELLAPATGIATMLADPEHLVSSEDVEVISDHYGVGNIVVEHQLDNRVLAANFDWQDGPATPAATRPALRQPALH
jgi:hypothetical protein